LPSIIPSYIYTLFACIIVGTIVIAACGVVAANVKHEADMQQLSNIAHYVAAKSLELVSQTSGENSSSTIVLNVPPLIGNQRYWIRIQNDSSNVWVEAGIGVNVFNSDQQASIPTVLMASGSCLSDSNPAYLECSSRVTGKYLTIYGGT
jgi:hypothetical protein